MMLTSTSSKGRQTAGAPPLSVVMPVHNALPHLDQAIESILGQTFGDFEFVILDDASTDNSRRRLLAWESRDSRIRLLTVDQNLGPVGSSNMVARAARAPLVARMDADDISYPMRIAEGVRLLRAHPEVGVVASLCDMIDASGRKIRGPEPWRLFKRSVFVPFAHGAMLYRREIFDEVGGYRKECEYWEDQDLVVRMAEISEVLVIPRPLYQVRQSAMSTRVLSDQEELESALDRAYRATDRLKGGARYDDVFNEVGSLSGKLDPRVFIALGSVRLWAGIKPRLFRRMISRARMSSNARTASALAWTAWASASPSTLRAFMLLLLKLRNRIVSRRVLDSPAVRWRPSRRAEEAKTGSGP